MPTAPTKNLELEKETLIIASGLPVKIQFDFRLIVPVIRYTPELRYTSPPPA
jgi:hypothetical protein